MPTSSPASTSGASPDPLPHNLRRRRSGSARRVVASGARSRGIAPAAVHLWNAASSRTTRKRTPELRGTTKRLWVSLMLGFLLLTLGLLDPDKLNYGNNAHLIAQSVLATLLVFYCAGPVLSRGWKSTLRTRRFTVDTLLSLGIGAAYLYSIAAVVYLVSDATPLAAPNYRTASDGS